MSGYQERRWHEESIALRLVHAVTATGMRGLLSLFAVTVAVLVIADVQSPVRAVLTFVFLMVVPGLALLDCWQLAGGWLGGALAVATSVSLATLLTTAQLYVALWSPPGTVVALALVTVAAQYVVVFRHYRADPTIASSSDRRIGARP